MKPVASAKKKPVQRIGTPSVYSKTSAPGGGRGANTKAAPARSNAGGATRGKSRATQVQAMKKGPTHGNKTSAAANAKKQNRVVMDKGRRARAAAPKAAGAGSPMGFDLSGIGKEISNFLGGSNAINKHYQTVGNKLKNPRSK